MKESFDIPAKRRVRKAYRRFLKHNKPKDISNVLCLSGYEAIEVKEVYDKLGISRSRIISCEMNDENFKLLRLQGLGMRYYHGDIVDYLGKTKRKFDIINLDFCGTFNSRILDAVNDIFGRKLLNNNGILAFTFLARRENAEVKKILKDPFLLEGLMEFSNRYVAGEDRTTESKNLHRLVNDEQTVYRDGIDRQILHTAFLGTYEGRSKINDTITYNEFADDMEQRQKNFGKRTPEELLANWEEKDEFHAETTNGMIPIKIERYSYHSDNGSPMRTSFYKFEDTYPYYKKYMKYHNAMEWGDFIYDLLVRATVLPEVYQIHAPKKIKEEENMPKKVAKKMDEVTKKRIVKALRAGVSKDKIARIFGVTKMQVSALDAWRTMGKKY